MIIDMHTHSFPDKIAAGTIRKLSSLSHTVPFTDGTESGLQETHHRNLYVAGIFIHNINGQVIYDIAKMSIEAGADGINFFSANLLKKGDKLNYVKKIKKELCE